MIRTRLQQARTELPGSPTATVLAKRARLSRGQLSQIERGEVRPGSRARVKLAKALGLTLPQFDAAFDDDRLAFLEREMEATRARRAERVRGR